MSVYRVICIKNIYDDDKISGFLKLGKMYMASIWDDKYLIISGLVYLREWFISVEEHRDKKLEELGI